MASLPIIVGFGGINAAGRTSFHHGYRRMVADRLDSASLQETYTGLATLMNLLQYAGGEYKGVDGETVNLQNWLAKNRAYIDEHTLIREIESSYFDTRAVAHHTASRLTSTLDGAMTFTLKARHMPSVLPENWQAHPVKDHPELIQVKVQGSMDILLADIRESLVKSAGQVPSGFDPATLYPSRNHPRGLQLTIYASSDAVQSVGIDWQRIAAAVAPDQIAVYASSAMGQLDENGSGGMLQAGLRGKRVTSKQCPLGLSEMPADFVNAYVIGSVGGTGANIGACATFLYNLHQAVEAIRSGLKKVVIVGGSDAPILPEVIEGYRTMGALAEDHSLIKLDPGAVHANHRRASRPFADNCGFTLAESSQYVVLMADEVAVEMGAHIYGAIADVFINADGFKKSISGPGVGNYITMAKAMASLRAILGEEGMRRSFVQAHGTSTPQNRVTESHIINETAKAFGIKNWPLSAVKSYLGHSLGAASADQLAATLGVWKYGYIPGITTIDRIADDVYSSHLNILTDHLDVGPQGTDAAVLNAKGFGGNNATAGILAPHVVSRMLGKKYGQQNMRDYAVRNEAVAEQAAQYDADAIKGLTKPLYHFGTNVRDGDEVFLSDQEIKITGYDNTISLDLKNPYPDMT